MADVWKVGTDFLVNTQLYGDQRAPTITQLVYGGFVVAWEESTHPKINVKIQLFSANGGKVGSELSVNTEPSGSGERPAITALANGGFVVSWLDGSDNLAGSGKTYTDVKAQVFTADGTKIGSEFLVDKRSDDVALYQTITALSNGSFVVTWFDTIGQPDKATNTIVRAQLFGADGAKIGTEITVNPVRSKYNGSPNIMPLSDGGFIVSWTMRDDTVAQKFNGDGVKVGNEIVFTRGREQAPVDLTAILNGGFVGSWEKSTLNKKTGNYDIEIMAQVFGADGSKVGAEISVSTQKEGYKSPAKITSLASGGFVVSWTEYALGDGYNRIKAQVFNAIGENWIASSLLRPRYRVRAAK